MPLACLAYCNTMLFAPVPANNLCGHSHDSTATDSSRLYCTHNVVSFRTPLPADWLAVLSSFASVPVCSEPCRPSSAIRRKIAQILNRRFGVFTVCRCAFGCRCSFNRLACLRWRFVSHNAQFAKVFRWPPAVAVAKTCNRAPRTHHRRPKTAGDVLRLPAQRRATAEPASEGRALYATAPAGEGLGNRLAVFYFRLLFWSTLP